jgi:hypothetical protein
MYREPDRRRFHRIAFPAPARLCGPGGSWVTRVLDVSLKGILLERPPGWSGQEGEAFEVVFDLGQGGAQVRMEAETAHTQDHRLGLRCRQIDLDSITHLRRLVELNLGAAELLQREVQALMDSATAASREAC